MVAWKDGKHTGSAMATLGHGLVLFVEYEGILRLPEDEPKYNVRVFGVRLQTRCASMQEGKTRAEGVAKKWLKEALVAIE